MAEGELRAVRQVEIFAGVFFRRNFGPSARQHRIGDRHLADVPRPGHREVRGGIDPAAQEDRRSRARLRCPETSRPRPQRLSRKSPASRSACRRRGARNDRFARCKHRLRQLQLISGKLDPRPARGLAAHRRRLADREYNVLRLLRCRTPRRSRPSRRRRSARPRRTCPIAAFGSPARRPARTLTASSRCPAPDHGPIISGPGVGKRADQRDRSRRLRKRQDVFAVLQGTNDLPAASRAAARRSATTDGLGRRGVDAAKGIVKEAEPVLQSSTRPTAASMSSIGDEPRSSASGRPFS